jgi:uncharacterized membrane protein
MPGGWGQQYYPQTKPEMCGEAVACLVFGIASVFFNSFFLLPSIAAIILGIVALTKIRKHPERYGGKALAIVGLVLGIVFFIIFLFAIIFLVRMASNPELMRAFEHYIHELEQI